MHVLRVLLQWYRARPLMIEPIPDRRTETTRLPSRARYSLLVFTTVLAIITYLDRVAISSAAPAVRAELFLSPVQMGWVFSAFTWAYAAFEIPSGWMGDVMGPRKVLTRIVLWWSAFTAATGLAWNFVSLVVARFLFGMGEAGAFPNTSRSFAKWFPVEERGAAHGAVFMGTRLGGAITPPLVVMLIGAIGWRQTFFAFGGLGVIWAWFWWRWFRDEPSSHRSVNAAELAIIEKGADRSELPRFRWPELWSINLLLIYGMYFTMGYTLYFNLTWLPTYLKDVRGFTLQQAGWLSGIVLFTGAISTYLGGKLTDALVKKHGLKVGRSMGVVTLPVAGLLLITAAMTQNPIAAAILLAATLGVADLGVSSCWAICHDIAGRYAGIVTGAMNTFGNIGGALSPLVVGYAVGWWNSWTVPFYITAGVYVFGGICTLLVNPRKRLMEPI
jgi:MFS transporter, ACS family, glucarate transporter